MYHEIKLRFKNKFIARQTLDEIKQDFMQDLVGMGFGDALTGSIIFDLNKDRVRAAIARCSLRITRQFALGIDGDLPGEYQNVYERWTEASICLMRLIPEDYPNVDLS
jgi:hypothetical protein